MATTPGNNQGGASTADLLTALKNVAQALNDQITANNRLAGNQVAQNISTPTLISAAAGRLVKVSVLVAGAEGRIYDSNSATNTTRPLAVIPATEGIVEIGLPASFGLYVVPGAGQSVTVGYS